VALTLSYLRNCATTQLGKVALDVQVALELVYVGLLAALVEILIVKLLCLLLGPVRLPPLPGVVVVEMAGGAALAKLRNCATWQP
jgi:hypothetical protein